MSSFNNLKMIAGTAKTSHILLLVTSVILIGVGVYGAVVSKEYGCDSGLFINLKNKNNDIKSSAWSKISKCVSDEFKGPIIPPGGGPGPVFPPKKKFNLNTLDSCLDEHAKGHVKCMEGGLMTFSTISIIVGVLMLLLSGYLLFM
jgi:hypothetical protein